MPRLTIVEGPTVELAEGAKLAVAVEDAGVDIGHRCGGFARCTTCRVEFFEGEPSAYTRAEYEKLKERKLLGKCRLSCQILVEEDMTVRPLMLVDAMGWADPGPKLMETVTPEPEWLDDVSAHD